MAESNKMKDMPVNKLMIQMGIPMILSMALQAVYNIVDSAFVGNMRVGSEAALNALTLGIFGSDAYGSGRNRNRCRNQCTSCKDTWTGKQGKGCKGSRKQSVSGCDHLRGLFTVWYLWGESIYFITDS